jgi:hypothetical protein
MVEVAATMNVSPKRIQNMMNTGPFRPGEHFFRRGRIGARLVRSRVDVAALMRGGADVRIAPREAFGDGFA